MAQEQTANPSQEKRVRLIRPSIILLCGPAACGKSTFAERHFRPTQIISSDWARGRVCDDERDQRFQSQAFALVRYLTELRLGLNRLCVVDSTALTPPHRREFLELARHYQVPCVVFLFDIPLEKCIERDRTRERTVGGPVIERHYLAFTQTKAEIHQEGFDQVVELGEGDLEKVQIEIVFRPIPQPLVTPGRRSQGDTRPTPRPWQPKTGRPPGAHEPGPPSPTQPLSAEAKPESASPTQSPPPAAKPGPTSPAKPEAKVSGPPGKPASAPQPGRAPTPPGAAATPATRAGSPPSSSPGTDQSAPGGKTTP